MKAIGKKVLIGFLMVVLVLVGGFAWYVMDDYDANEVALQALNSTEKVEVNGEDPIQFSPQGASSEVGIIFYPGGKVEEEAYAPLMQALAEEGYSVFLVDMPFGLAVLDVNAAEEIMAEHSEISEWYLAGHSLGGAMAALFAENNVSKLAGLILLASYSTADLSESGLSVLSILGSEDQVMDSDKIAEYRPMLPSDAVEVVISGGNHAQFGSYGFQTGDGSATITAFEQQVRTVEEMLDFIEMNQ